MLDAWFDKDLIIRYRKPPGLSRDVTSRLNDIVYTNDFLLSEIRKAITNPFRKVNELVTDYESELASITEEAKGFSPLSKAVAEHESPATREQLRDQLYDCLLLLDLLTNDAGLLYRTSFRVSNREAFDVYQLIYFIAMVIQKEVNALDLMTSSIQGEIAMYREESTGACCFNTSRK